MSRTLANSLTAATQWEPKLPFDLVVAYEDNVTRGRALHLYDHLAHDLLDDCDFKVSWWKFDHLAEAALREQAVEEAATANMVVLALRARPELPATSKAWIEEWVRCRDGRKSALAVVIASADSQLEDTSHLLAWLRQMAKVARMDFFHHSFDLPKPTDELSVDRVQARAEARTPVLEQILRRAPPSSRWGINE